jgi:hypothetical protein
MFNGSTKMTNVAAKIVRRVGQIVGNHTLPVNRSPIIFLGKGKSGTTAIAALFAQATGKSVALDIPALFVDGLRPILKGDKDLWRVVRTQRIAFSKDVLKQPTLTWVYKQLRELFPGARFVMIVRDPRSNIRSVFNRMAIPGDLSDLTPDEIRNIHGGWRWHFSEPELLGITGANYVELSANRWNRAADVYLDNSDDMLLVRYEDFMTDRVGYVAQLARQLDCPVVADISERVDDQYQPRGTDRGRAWVDFFGARNLETIERLCGPRMRELGYELDGAVASAERPANSKSR